MLKYLTGKTMPGIGAKKQQTGAGIGPRKKTKKTTRNMCRATDTRRDIIGCMNNWVEGWIDWNMVLDQNGGPNLASNWCIAPVIVDTDRLTKCISHRCTMFSVTSVSLFVLMRIRTRHRHKTWMR